MIYFNDSFLAGVESTDQCLLNSKVLSCFSGVIMSIRSFFYLVHLDHFSDQVLSILLNFADFGRFWHILPIDFGSFQFLLMIHFGPFASIFVNFELF